MALPPGMHGSGVTGTWLSSEDCSALETRPADGAVNLDRHEPRVPPLVETADGTWRGTFAHSRVRSQGTHVTKCAHAAEQSQELPPAGRHCHVKRPLGYRQRGFRVRRAPRRARTRKGPVASGEARLPDAHALCDEASIPAGGGVPFPRIDRSRRRHGFERRQRQSGRPAESASNDSRPHRENEKGQLSPLGDRPWGSGLLDRRVVIVGHRITDGRGA